MTQTLDKELKTLMRGQSVDAGPFAWGKNDNLGTVTKRVHAVLGLRPDNPDLDVVLELAQRLLGAHGYKLDNRSSSKHFKGGLPRWFTPSDECVIRGAGTGEANGSYLADGNDFVKSPYTLEAFVDAMVVEGAGTTAANGTYRRLLPDFLGLARYGKYDSDGVTPLSQLSFSPTDGIILARFDPLVQLYKDPDATSYDDIAFTPDGGDAPAPTVRRATLADSGITAAVVTWRIVDGSGNIVYNNATASLTPPATGWAVGTGDADAPTVNRLTFADLAAL